ncbi:replication-relaxation family protein [Arthrobacter sp. KNU40]|uniref:replication-relaxation family protein n=1 Tax=Arthrobacter sp. KNU40 TaxID=3447965 RepID=UPI003F64168C
MRLTTRDADIIRSVDQFGQLAAGHIWDLHFYNNQWKNSIDRVLQRLVRDKFLSRVERRLVGGNGGGSGQYVYQIGPSGWDFLGKRGKYVPPHRTVKHHHIEIADAFIEVLAEVRSGRLKLLNYLTEPNTHMTLSGITIRPDLFVDVEFVDQGLAAGYWIEVDRGFESLSTIGDMVIRYLKAHDSSTTSDFEAFPLVWFLVPDEQRKHNIEGVIRREAGERAKMFEVHLAKGFAEKIA